MLLQSLGALCRAAKRRTGRADLAGTSWRNYRKALDGVSALKDAGTFVLAAILISGIRRHVAGRAFWRVVRRRDKNEALRRYTE